MSRTEPFPPPSRSGVRHAGHARPDKSDRGDHRGDNGARTAHAGARVLPALRTVKPDAPVELRYPSTHHGVIRVATIFDLGPDRGRLYVHCRQESR